MLRLGLSAADWRAYKNALVNSHRIRVTARIHDGDEKPVSTITSRILSGAVQVDMSQSPIRTLELTLLEPRRAPAWLPDGASDSHVFANNFISVRRGVWVKDLSDGPGWVDVPVFWGPIVGLDADGETVTIHAAGKEILSLDPHLLWNPLTLHKGQKRTSAIREVLGAQGEARFDLPELRAKLGKKMSLGRHAQPWRVAKAIAGGMDRQLYYDGRGRARVRNWPQNRLWVFHGGKDGSVLSRPRVSYSIESARNIVEVLGTEPKGPPERIRAVARAKAKHPLSAGRLKRNGQNRFMVHVVDSNLSKPELEWHKRHKDDGELVPGRWGAPSGRRHPGRWFEWRHSVIVERNDKAEAIAERQLENLLHATIDVAFESFVIPHLEEGDRVAVRVDGQHFQFILKQFTIPLTADESMSIGFNKRVSWRHKKKRHRGRGRRRS